MSEVEISARRKTKEKRRPPPPRFLLMAATSEEEEILEFVVKISRSKSDVAKGQFVLKGHPSYDIDLQIRPLKCHLC